MCRVVPLLLALALTSPLRAGDVPVLIYADVDASSLTDLAQPLSGDDYPLDGILLRLARGSEAALLTTSADGRATFSGVTDGSWLLRPVLDAAFPEPPPCTSHNLPTRLVEKVLSGDGTPLVYVALGDSSPKLGSSEGRPYPVRLAELLEPHFAGGVTLQNRADPGTVTADWLPGAFNFEAAAGYVAAADLVTLTLGGNDMQNAIDGGSFASAPAVVDQAIDNLATIVSALTALNPNADIVVTVYPNYAKSDLWARAVPANLLEMVRSVVETALKKMRAELAGVDGALIGDVYGELQAADMNLFMADELHVNDLGHDVYAKVIFRALGGVFLPDDAGRERAWGFELEPKPLPPEPSPEAVVEEPANGPDVLDTAEGLDAADGLEATEGLAPDPAPEASDDLAMESDGAGGCVAGDTPAQPLPFALLALLAALARRTRRA